MKGARRRIAVAVAVSGTAGLLIAFTLSLRGKTFAILQPKGTVSTSEQHLLLFAAVLSLVVVLPVFILLFSFVWRYRDRGTADRYSPELRNQRTIEIVWWAVPTALIIVLSVVAWNSAHELDPYASLRSAQKPVNVQVVALDWKWLFIYPDDHIATVNALVIPVKRPIHFTLTADAPMNSFAIPQLSGQIYAMPGMQTQLNMDALATGDYFGESANLSGTGFSGMRFDVRAVSQSDFSRWLGTTSRTQAQLDATTYASLRRPSENVPAEYFRLRDDSLFDAVMAQYMGTRCSC